MCSLDTGLFQVILHSIIGVSNAEFADGTGAG